MSRDVLLYGLSQSIEAALLMAWKEQTPGLHDFVPDYHRLQLEHWIWSNRERLGAQILDIGVDHPRRWLGDGYLTFGEHDEDQTGDLLASPFPDASFDSVLLTEVLEHCTDPKRAICEVFRVLKSGGLLLVTSPFAWPEHGVEGRYRDYWRFTRHGWELLLSPFTKVEITPCGWTSEADAAYDIMRRFEGMGFQSQTQWTTGYLCEAVKP